MLPLKKINNLVFHHFHFISPVSFVIHKEKAFNLSGLAEAECAILLALGTAAGIPGGR